MQRACKTQNNGDTYEEPKLIPTGFKIPMSGTDNNAEMDSDSDLVPSANRKLQDMHKILCGLKPNIFMAQKQSSSLRKQKPAYRYCLNDSMTWNKGDQL